MDQDCINELLESAREGLQDLQPLCASTGALFRASPIVARQLWCSAERALHFLAAFDDADLKQAIALQHREPISALCARWRSHDGRGLGWSSDGSLYYKGPIGGWRKLKDSCSREEAEAELKRLIAADRIRSLPGTWQRIAYD